MPAARPNLNFLSGDWGAFQARTDAALVGRRIAERRNLTPGQAFTAAVLGGIGNVRGAMLGGLLLGLIENLGVACVGTQWQQVISFVVLVLVLMFRPTGLLGEQVGE